MADLHLNDFRYGLVTLPDALQLPVGAAQVADNVELDHDGLIVRDGRVIHARCPVSASAGVRALQEFYVYDPASTFHRFVAVIGTRVYWAISTDTAPAWVAGTTYAAGAIVRPTMANGYIYECTVGGTSHGSTQPTWKTIPYQSTGYVTADWTNTDNTVTWVCHSAAVFQEIDSSVTVHATNPIRMVQYADKLYLVDGSAAVRRVNTAGVWETLTDFTAPTVAPSIRVDYDAYTIDDASDPSPIFGDPSTKGTYRGYYYQAYSMGYPLGPSRWISAVSSGTTATFWRAKQGSTAPDNAEVYGITSRQLRVAANTYGDETASMALEIVANAAVSTATAGDVYYYTKFATPKDLSAVSAVSVRFNVHSGTGSKEMPTSMALVFGETSTMASWISLPIDLSGLGHDTDQTVTVSLNTVDASDRDAVLYFGVYLEGLELDTTARVELDSGDFGNPSAGHYPASNSGEQSFTNGAWITFGPFGATTNTANGFISDTYEFTYSYTDDAGEESGEYINATDFNNPYPSVVVGTALPQQMVITCTKDAGSTATGCNVYARSALTGGDVRKIGSKTFGDATTAELTWTGEYGDTLLSTYVGKPPSGCTMLALWQNRMVYVGRSVGAITGARDVLYFSNYGDPAHVPQTPDASLAQRPVTLGGWADTERYGADVTGLAPIGEVLLAFKARGAWAFSGDPGTPDFKPTQLLQREGCVSHESIKQVEGVLTWLSRDAVLQWVPGMATPKEVTRDLSPTVAGYTAAQQSAAFAVYDPQERRYWLILPATTSPGTTPLSTALVWHLRARDGNGDGGWARYTGLPGACGLYTPYATTPGIYLADIYGTSGRGKLFRVSSSAVTDQINFGDAAEIDWTWVSGEVLLPKERRMVTVTEMRVKALTNASSGTFTVTLGYYPNNTAASSVTRAATVNRLAATGTRYSGVATWNPAPRAVESLAVKLGKSTSAVLGVRDVVVALTPRTVIR